MKNVNKPCSERLRENCIGCDKEDGFGDTCHAYQAYQQGREDERKEWESATAELLVKYAGDIYKALPEQVAQIRADAIDEYRKAVDEWIKSDSRLSYFWTEVTTQMGKTAEQIKEQTYD